MLYSAGRTEDAAEYLLELVSTFGEEEYTRRDIAKWVSGELMFCLLVHHSLALVVRFHRTISQVRQRVAA